MLLQGGPGDGPVVPGRVNRRVAGVPVRGARWPGCSPGCSVSAVVRRGLSGRHPRPDIAGRVPSCLMNSCRRRNASPDASSS